MRFLFIHQNFPGQFKYLAPALASSGHKVIALTLKDIPETLWNGVNVRSYKVSRSTSTNIHPWLTDFETKVIRGEGCLNTFITLKEQNFYPDVVIAHHGWGESLFVKDIWPKTKIGIYCEFFYHPVGADFNFDPEFRVKNISEFCRLRLKNINNYMNFEIADLGLSPTSWQASTFPDFFRSKISVIHDGIDTNLLKPDSSATYQLNNNLTLTKNDEIITFVNRNLEPCRGFHIFIRSLPRILKSRPYAKVIIVGGSDISYGPKPVNFKSWKECFFSEIEGSLSTSELERIHFVGMLDYLDFISVLQLSTVHVYLTYPFVLSWSLLEAMSIGCCVVASDTKPLHEVIVDNETGFLIDFFNSEKLATSVLNLLDSPETRKNIGCNARSFIKSNYDLSSICLPRQLSWVNKLLSS